MSEGVLNRFLKYVRYNTQSVRESDTEPSSAKELVLAEELVRELKDLGITGCPNRQRRRCLRNDSRNKGL